MLIIIHTADWHIGQSLNGWSRRSEHELFFQRLADLLVRENVDVLLVAGDVFDNSNPSGDDQELFYKTLAEFKRRRPTLNTVISGGNHDPAVRLEAPSPVLKALDVHVVGTVRRKDGKIDIAQHLFPIKDANGTIQLYVLGVPFLRASDLTLTFATGSEMSSPIVEATKVFFDQASTLAAEIVGDVPIFATSHLHCAGGLESEGAERRILIGGAHALPPNVFPKSFDYVALGHLHGPQSLDSGRVRYSGSCFPLSASEISYSHGVTLLNLEDGKFSISHIDIDRPAPMIRIPPKGTVRLSDLMTLLDQITDDADTPVGLRPIVYVELATTDSAAVIMADAAKMVSDRNLRLGGIRIHREVTAQPPVRLVTSLNETNPENIFIDAYKAENGIAPEERHLVAFRDIVAGI